MPGNMSQTWSFLGLFMTFYFFIPAASTISCGELKMGYEKHCLETAERSHYLQCVRTRMKRHQRDCEYDYECTECQCEMCAYNQCGGQCDNCCHSCCSNYIRCHTNHCCHKQCNFECRSSSCRNNCRNACYNTVEREKTEFIKYDVAPPASIVAPPSTSNNNTNTNTLARVSNITTIITVKNVINSTNQVDIPINLTCSNQNNITLNENEKADKLDGCCIVIGPRQCQRTSTSPYIKCFHTRSRQCGSYCTAKIVHEENRQICSSTDSFGRPANCQQQTTYIPQPQPKCVYTSVWPYVSCGIQPPAECDGCYGQNLNQAQPCPSQCYDSFGTGPLYRPGPYYPNGFSPQMPPCMMSPQGCGGVGGYGGGYGQYPGFGVGGNMFGQSFGGGLFGLGAAGPNPASYIPLQEIQPSFNGTENDPKDVPVNDQAGLGQNNDMEIEVTLVDPEKSRDRDSYSYVTRRDADPKKKKLK